MISAWQLYFILQMDSIGNGVAMLALFAMIIAAAMLIAGSIIRDKASSYGDCTADPTWIKGVAVQKKGLRWVALAGVLVFVSNLIPSTRTLAAMVVIPAIVNNETVRNEAGELYQLAKQALANAVAPAPKQERGDD